MILLLLILVESFDVVLGAVKRVAIFGGDEVLEVFVVAPVPLFGLNGGECFCFPSGPFYGTGLTNFISGQGQALSMVGEGGDIFT